MNARPPQGAPGIRPALSRVAYLFSFSMGRLVGAIFDGCERLTQGTGFARPAPSRPPQKKALSRRTRKVPVLRPTAIVSCHGRSSRPHRNVSGTSRPK